MKKNNCIQKNIFFPLSNEELISEFFSDEITRKFKHR